MGKKAVLNLYTDAAKEFTTAARALGVDHQESLPGEPKTNAIIERTNHIVVGGTTAPHSAACRSTIHHRQAAVNTTATRTHKLSEEFSLDTKRAHPTNGINRIWYGR